MAQSIIKPILTGGNNVNDRQMAYQKRLFDTSFFANNIIAKYFIITAKHKTHPPFIFRMLEMIKDDGAGFKTKPYRQFDLLFNQAYKREGGHQFSNNQLDSEIVSKVNSISPVKKHEPSISARAIGHSKPRISTYTQHTNKRLTMPGYSNSGASSGLLPSHSQLIQRKAMPGVNARLTKSNATYISPAINQEPRGEFAKPVEPTPDGVIASSEVLPFATGLNDNTIATFSVNPQLNLRANTIQSMTLAPMLTRRPALNKRSKVTGFIQRKPTAHGINQAPRGELTKPVEPSPEGVIESSEVLPFTTGLNDNTIAKFSVDPQLNPSTNTFQSMTLAPMLSRRPALNNRSKSTGFTQPKSTDPGINQAPRGQFAKPLEPTPDGVIATSEALPFTTGLNDNTIATFSADSQLYPGTDTFESMTFVPMLTRRPALNNRSESTGFIQRKPIMSVLNTTATASSSNTTSVATGIKQALRGEFAKPVEPSPDDATASSDALPFSTGSNHNTIATFSVDPQLNPGENTFQSMRLASILTRRPALNNRSKSTGFIQPKSTVPGINQEPRGQFAKPLEPTSGGVIAASEVLPFTAGLNDNTGATYFADSQLNPSTNAFQSMKLAPMLTHRPALNNRSKSTGFIQRKPTVPGLNAKATAGTSSTTVIDSGIKQRLGGDFARPVESVVDGQVATRKPLPVLLSRRSLKPSSIIFHSTQQPVSVMNISGLQGGRPAEEGLIQHKAMLNSVALSSDLDNAKPVYAFGQSTRDVDRWSGAQTVIAIKNPFTFKSSQPEEARVLRDQAFRRSTELTFKKPDIEATKKVDKPESEFSQQSISETQVTNQENAPTVNFEMTPPVPPPPSIQAIADKVYRMLERRLIVERERRGLI